jgi:hypothetical protein
MDPVQAMEVLLVHEDQAQFKPEGERLEIRMTSWLARMESQGQWCYVAFLEGRWDFPWGLKEDFPEAKGGT